MSYSIKIVFSYRTKLCQGSTYAQHAFLHAHTLPRTKKADRQTQIQSCVFVYLCVWLCQATNHNNFFTKNLFWLIEQLKIAVVEIYIQLMKFLALVWRKLLQCEKCWQPQLFMQIRGLNSLLDLYYRKWFLKIFSVRQF